MDDFRHRIFKAQNIHLPTTEPTTISSELTPLPWSRYFETQQTLTLNNTHFNIYASGLANTEGPIFVFHHGAGHTGLSFGLTAQRLLNLMPSATILAPDCRGHGLTSSSTSLSLDQLANDFVSLVTQLLPDNRRDVILVGHSMGGSVVAHAASRIPKVIGVVLIDIVEGTAMDSLNAIPGFINARPESFSSIQSAIQWHLESSIIRNKESARLSVPSLVYESNGRWHWKTDLLSTQPYWSGWYQGLSQTFVNTPAAKLLILAGTDRLDRELLVAQMQGKFQLELLPKAGHTIQEDVPDRISQLLHRFWSRNQPLFI